MENIFELEKSVEYQSGTIVSKQVIKKDHGTLTVFAFDQGQSLSEHSAPHDAFVYLLDGEGEFAIDKKPHLLHKGQTLIMPANIPHAVTAKKRFKMLLVMIK